jgi:hypothetical protein
VLSLLTLYATGAKNYGESALLVLIIASVICGTICGVHFIRLQRNMRTGVRWIVGIASVVGCIGAAFAIGMGGCFLSLGAVGRL